MASIKYRIRGKTKSELAIYIRLSVSREINLEINTGFTVKSENWSKISGFPKQSNAELKSLFNKLKKLEVYAFESLNKAQGEGEEIDKKWLKEVVTNCFNRKISPNEYGVTEHIQFVIDNAGTKRISGTNKIGLSKGRVTSYKTFKNNIKEFENYHGRRIRLTDLDSSLNEKFKQWLIGVKNFSVNYSGKQLDNLRAIANDAHRLGIQVHPNAMKIESFSESNEDRSIVTLSFDELNKIRVSKMPTAYLENAKKWLLLGCEIGQRGGDLLAITAQNIRNEEDYFFIDLIQQKTGKAVTIPIGSHEVQMMLLNEPPHKISQQKLNKYIKEVCKIAGLDELCDGKILDKTENRKVSGIYPKYQLVTTHSFRRSFATNFYKKIATPILITITGHKKEAIFLKYINRQEDKDENAKLFLKYYEEIKLK